MAMISNIAIDKDDNEYQRLLVEESKSSINSTIAIDKNTKRSMIKFDLSGIKIINSNSIEESAKIAIELVSSKNADFVMNTGVIVGISLIIVLIYFYIVFFALVYLY